MATPMQEMVAHLSAKWRLTMCAAEERLQLLIGA